MLIAPWRALLQKTFNELRLIVLWNFACQSTYWFVLPCSICFMKEKTNLIFLNIRSTNYIRFALPVQEMKSFRKYVGAGINPVVLAFPIVPDFWSFWIYGNYSFPVIPAFKSAVLRIRGFYPRYRILFFFIPDSGLTRFRDSAGGTGQTLYFHLPWGSFSYLRLPPISKYIPFSSLSPSPCLSPLHRPP